jgi:hypothetical protein
MNPNRESQHLKMKEQSWQRFRIGVMNPGGRTRITVSKNHGTKLPSHSESTKLWLPVFDKDRSFPVCDWPIADHEPRALRGEC